MQATHRRRSWRRGEASAPRGLARRGFARRGFAPRGWTRALTLVALVGAVSSAGCQEDIEREDDIAMRWECSFRSGVTTQQGHTAVTFSRGGGVSSQPRSGGSFRGRYTIANGTATVSITSSRQDALNPIAVGEEGVARLGPGGRELEIRWGSAPSFTCAPGP